MVSPILSCWVFKFNLSKGPKPSWPNAGRTFRPVSANSPMSASATLVARDGTDGEGGGAAGIFECRCHPEPFSQSESTARRVYSVLTCCPCVLFPPFVLSTSSCCEVCFRSKSGPVIGLRFPHFFRPYATRGTLALRTMHFRTVFITTVRTSRRGDVAKVLLPKRPKRHARPSAW